MQAIILAAGRSSRFHTATSKHLFPLCGKPLIFYTLKLAKSCAEQTILVVGENKSEIETALTGYSTLQPLLALQEKPRGTADAVFCSKEYWQSENLLILCGDMPLISLQTITILKKHHQETGAAITIVTAQVTNSRNVSYGRVLKKGKAVHIIEARQFNGPYEGSCSINAGAYIIRKDILETYYPTLAANSESGEFYFTDVINTIAADGHLVETIETGEKEVHGVNTLEELAHVEHLLCSKKTSELMAQGVHIATPWNTHIDYDVEIGADSFIGQNVILKSGTRIANNCHIEPFCIISKSTIDTGAIIKSHSVVTNSIIKAHVQVGPFAHISEQTTLSNNAVIGNFVETKRCDIGAYTKAKHLSFIADAVIEERVNIGAGTITCNYDGFAKNKTVVKSGAQVGSNNNLVAPVTIGSSAITAAGSTITENVPNDALGIARARQINKPDYASLIRARKTAPTKIPSLNDQPA